MYELLLFIHTYVWISSLKEKKIILTKVDQLETLGSQALWQIDLGWLADAYPAALSVPFLNRTEEKIRWKNLMGRDKDREVT